MSQDEEIELLRRIERYLRIQVREPFLKALLEIASTPQRRKIWKLCDGNNSIERISKEAGISIRAVHYFLEEAKEAGLIVFERRGYPKRVLDIIPREWRSKKVRGET